MDMKCLEAEADRFLQGGGYWKSLESHVHLKGSKEM